MPASPIALFRFHVISAYVALVPERGQRGAMLRKLAERTWTHPDGRSVTIAADTLRTWVRNFRRGGIEALEDAPRPRTGIRALTAEQIELFCRLKREVPERSLERLLLIATELGQIEPGSVARATLHRALKERALSGRPKPEATVTDLDRFEAAAPNDLWQSDMLAGPWLPDPDRPGERRRTWLYAFLDDHSRALLAGRFSFKGDLPALELVFRDALRRHGVPRRVYYDNGATYRAEHMQQIAAALGIHRTVHTTPYRPQGHGKIEAFNRLCKAAFVAEVKASTITTLDGLNAAFVAWSERFYNRRVHGETGAQPLARWREGLANVRHVDEEILRRAFLWSESRKPDKTGVFSLHGCRFQVGPELARKKVEVRYDPERMGEVEIWHDGRFAERVRPFEVRPHRRPPALVETPAPPAPDGPAADWLGHLASQRKSVLAEDPRAALERELARRVAANDAVVDVFRARLAAEVIDEPLLRRWLDRHGPLDAAIVDEVLELAVDTVGASQHLQHYLDALRSALLRGDA